MKRRFVILLIGALGLSACGAVSSGFLYSGETGFLMAEPSRVVYSIKSTFDKKEDLKVYLYTADGGLSEVPIDRVATTLAKLSVEDRAAVQGEQQLADSYSFGEDDPGAWEIGVSYADTEPTKYVITVLSAEEQAYYDSGGGGGGGIEITITGP
jgi:hypothetical protein